MGVACQRQIGTTIPLTISVTFAFGFVLSGLWFGLCVILSS